MDCQDIDWTARAEAATRIATEAGALALDFFADPGRLEIEAKAHQDWVSQADRAVETLVRDRIAAAFPDDAIVGEEHAPKPGTSGATWVIDPIDGTTNFINQIPAWCVAIAIVGGAHTRVGVIHDAVHSETFTATLGGGAALNGRALAVDPGRRVDNGTIGLGRSVRAGVTASARLVEGISRAGGVWARLGSGALSLAWVAAGRWVGYAEAHMNAWDCLAGQLLVAEARGRVEAQDASAMIANGGRVIAAAPGVFEDLVELFEASVAS